MTGLLKTMLRRRTAPSGQSRPKARLVSGDRAPMSDAVDVRRGRSYTRACLLVFIVALIYAGWVETMSQMRSAERFALVALEVRGIRMLDGEQVLKASGLSVGDNIFAVDLDSVAVRVKERLVWVRTARVERKPPDRLVVWVDERRRRAWVEIEDRMFGVDEDGVLLPEQALASETSRDLDLPVIKNLRLAESGKSQGDEPQKMAAGETVADSTLGAILAWWSQAREQDASFSDQISELRPFGEDALSVILGGDGLEIRLPIRGAKLGEQLHILNGALPAVYRDVVGPVYVDLRFVNQLVVGTAQAVVERLRHQQQSRRQIQSAAGQAQAISVSARGDRRG